MNIRKDLTLRKVGEEYIVVDADQGIADISKVFSLNNTAAFLWQNLAGKSFNIEDAADLLKSEYNINRELAIKDSKQIFEEFRHQNLLENWR